MTSIGDYAFYKCSGLTSLIVNIAKPLTISYNTFEECYNATLYVPAGSKAKYEAASYWKNFKTIIEMQEGDANGDESVSISDAVSIVNYILGNPAATFILPSADVNKDGVVTITDAVSVVNIILGQ